MKKKVKVLLPKVVYPCGVPFMVELCHMDSGQFGETETLDRTIKINTDPEKSKDAWHTLFHEYLHAVLGVSGFSEVLMSDRGQDFEEGLVRLLEFHLYPLIDKKKLAKRPY